MFLDNTSNRFKAMFCLIWHQGFIPSVLSAGTFLKEKGKPQCFIVTHLVAMVCTCLLTGMCVCLCFGHSKGHQGDKDPFHDHSRTPGCCSQPNPCPQSSASSQLPALTAITTVKTQIRLSSFVAVLSPNCNSIFPPPFHIASPSSKLFPLFLSPPSIAVKKRFPLSNLMSPIHRKLQLESVQKFCPLVPRKQQSICLAKRFLRG